MDTHKDSLHIPETSKENQDSFTSLEEAAEEYSNKNEYMDVGFCVEPVYIGHKTERAFIAGARWQKEQMLKDAVEAEVLYFGETQDVSRTIKIPQMQEWLKPFKDGDKVRIVILKQKEE